MKLRDGNNGTIYQLHLRWYRLEFSSWWLQTPSSRNVQARQRANQENEQSQGTVAERSASDTWQQNSIIIDTALSTSNWIQTADKTHTQSHSNGPFIHVILEMILLQAWKPTVSKHWRKSLSISSSPRNHVTHLASNSEIHMRHKSKSIYKQTS